MVLDIQQHLILLIHLSFRLSTPSLNTALNSHAQPTTPANMQTKALLVAAIGSQIALAQTTATSFGVTQASECITAVATILSAIAAVPTPTGPLAKYLNDAQDKDLDPCSWAAAAPSSITSEMSSYGSALSSAIAANSSPYSQIVSCANALGGNKEASSLVPFGHVTDCKATPTGATPTGATPKSKNAAPAQTGVAAVAGVAAAALVGVAGLI